MEIFQFSNENVRGREGERKRRRREREREGESVCVCVRERVREIEEKIIESQKAKYEYILMQYGGLETFLGH